MKWFWFAVIMAGGGLILASAGDTMAIAAFALTIIFLVKAQER